MEVQMYIGDADVDPSRRNQCAKQFVRQRMLNRGNNWQSQKQNKQNEIITKNMLSISLSFLLKFFIADRANDGSWR